MVPPPLSVGLTLCSYVYEEGGETNRVSLIGTFTKLRVESFPVRPSFFVFFRLTDGLGDGTITLQIQRLGTDEEIYVRHSHITFPDKLRIVQGYFPVHHCTFPAAGWYQIALLIDDELIAQCRLQIQ